MMASQEKPPAQELPFNVEAEAALLGALMIDNRLIDRIADKIRPEHFFEPLHQRIYSVIVRERQMDRRADPVTLKPYFVDDEGAREVGGPAYLAQLTGSGAGVIGADDFATQVRELAQRRTLITGLNRIVGRTHDWETGFDELSAAVETLLAEAEESTDGVEEMSASDCIGGMLDRIEEGVPPGVLSGITPIDEALGSIRGKDLVIVAGRPGMGKSVVGLNYARAVATSGSAVDFYSLEMSKDQIAARLAAEICFERGTNVPFDAIESGKLTTEQFRAVCRAREDIRELPLGIVDLPTIRVGQINRRIKRSKRRWAAKGKILRLAIVDYLQLIQPDSKCENRTQEITKVSMGLKASAKANDVGLMALAQLSRAVEQRGDHRPQLSDLRESGQIEQDADLILFLYRQEYYLQQAEPRYNDESRDKWEKALEACKNQIEYICSKRRQGRTGTKRGSFYGHVQAVR